MLGNFVFDIDGTMTKAMSKYDLEQEEQRAKERLGEAFMERHTIMAVNYPHYVYPGLYALFRWLHAKGGRLFFFSSGVEERNLEFTAEFMRRAFGEQADEVPYQVYSRHHCIDTPHLDRHEPGAGAAYQSFYYGQLKKKLAGVVVAPEELPHTLLIDDDASYMVKGEEYNFLRLRYPHRYFSPFEEEDSWLPEKGELDLSGFYAREFITFHQAYYIAGILEAIFEHQAAEQLTLIEAAKQVQIDREGEVLSREFYYPSTFRFSYFRRGLEILRGLDPTLQFYFPAILQEHYKNG